MSDEIDRVGQTWDLGNAIVVVLASSWYTYVGRVEPIRRHDVLFVEKRSTGRSLTWIAESSEHRWEAKCPFWTRLS